MKRMEKSARSLALFNKAGKFDLTYENNFTVHLHIEFATKSDPDRVKVLVTLA